jgi:hypothetical protein
LGEKFAQWVIVYFGLFFVKIKEVAQIIWLLFFPQQKLCTNVRGKNDWATFWATFSQTHLVTLLETLK